MATVVITGGAGFLGSHLVDKLVKRKDKVIVVDDLVSGRLANLSKAVATGRVTFIYSDRAVRSDTLRALLQRSRVGGRIDTIFHLAPAIMSPLRDHSMLREHSRGALSPSVLGTTSLIELALEQEARIVFPSVWRIPDDSSRLPHAKTPSTHPDRSGPRAFPEESRCFVETAVAEAARNRGLDARIVRFHDCYGPRMQKTDGPLIPALIDAGIKGRPFPIYGTGLQTRALTYVEDAVDLLLLVAASSASEVAPIDIGSDNEHTIVAIARSLAKILAINYSAEFIDIPDSDDRAIRPALARARELGWSPSTSLEDGLRSTCNWFTKELHAYA